MERPRHPNTLVLVDAVFLLLGKLQQYAPKAPAKAAQMTDLLEQKLEAHARRAVLGPG
jgi:hypothetical protein